MNKSIHPFSPPACAVRPGGLRQFLTDFMCMNIFVRSAFVPSTWKTTTTVTISTELKSIKKSRKTFYYYFSFLSPLDMDDRQKGRTNEEERRVERTNCNKKRHKKWKFMKQITNLMKAAVLFTVWILRGPHQLLSSLEEWMMNNSKKIRNDKVFNDFNIFSIVFSTWDNVVSIVSIP